MYVYSDVTMSTFNGWQRAVDETFITLISIDLYKHKTFSGHIKNIIQLPNIIMFFFPNYEWYNFCFTKCCNILL